MALKQQIQDDLKSAMLGGDRFIAEVVRGLKSTILYEEIAQNKRDSGLDDAAIETLLAREVKKRGESAELYEKGGNQESADKERAEAKIIQGYLPEQMSEADVREVVERTVAELGAEGPQAMGQVIGKVRQEVGTKADGAIIAKLAKEALNK